MISDATVCKFEEAFAKYLGVKAGFAFWKGRVAIYTILRALGIGENDEVILPGYTCVTAVNPIKFLGALPVYADIDRTTFGMIPEQVEAKITPATKCIFAQFTFGIPPEMDAILDIANRHGIPVVEDACQGLGSLYKGKTAGQFGIAAGYSMQWTKTWTSGIGGLASTDDADLAKKIASIREEEMHAPGRKEAALLSVQRSIHRAIIYPSTTTFMTRMYRWFVRKGVLVGSATPAELSAELQTDPKFFKAMSCGQARSGLRQLKGALDRNLAHRREMRQFYDGLLDACGHPRLVLPDYMDPALVRYPVWVADKSAALALARKRMIELGEWFDKPLHQCEVPMTAYDYEDGCCPQAEEAVKYVVNLPMHPRVSKKHAAKAVEIVREIGPLK